MTSWPRVLIISFLVVWSLFCGVSAHAAYAWYYGTVKRIFMFNGGFVLRMNSTALDDCKHQYIYFRDGQLGESTVDRAYSMALTAQASGRLLGVVIDKAINRPDGYCNSNGSVDIKD